MRWNTAGCVRDVWSGGRNTDEKSLPRSLSMSRGFATTGRIWAGAMTCVMLHVVSRLHRHETCQHMAGPGGCVTGLPLHPAS